MAPTGQWYDPNARRKGGWGGDDPEALAKRAKHINHAISLGWKKKLNGRDVVDVPGHDAKKIRWNYLFRGLYLGYVDEIGQARFFRDLALTDEYGQAQLEPEEVQILALLAMREYPEIIAEW